MRPNLGKDQEGKRPPLNQDSNDAAVNQPTNSDIFSCPFYKRDPLKHADCDKYELSRIQDVKQHLSRRHQMPPWCPRCYATFDHEILRDEHVRDVNCTVRPARKLDGMSEYQWKQLREEAPASQSSRDQWYDIYDILFPGHKWHPLTPYRDKPSRLLASIYPSAGKMTTGDKAPGLASAKADTNPMIPTWPVHVTSENATSPFESFNQRTMTTFSTFNIVLRPSDGHEPTPVPSPPRILVPAGKKRGRPSRADKAKRDLRPLLPEHIVPRPSDQDLSGILDASRPRPLRRSASDSVLGSSIASTHDEADTEHVSKKTIKPVTATPVTRSVNTTGKEQLAPLSRRAVDCIHEHILSPLLEAETLRDFHHIILSVPQRIRTEDITCLRDLEKSLIFLAPEKAKSSVLYLDFCLQSIRCIQATIEYISEREKIRPGDRPYTNGYFIDLKEQIYKYARELANAEKAGLSDGMDVESLDEIKLHGGLAENGRPAELIRIHKDGSAVSIATGEPVDLVPVPVPIMRTLNEQRDVEKEIMLSMARRKKNATAEELAPKKCREVGCKKEFKRPCDLTKHEKTHSRPWKCPIPTCKYHEFGWPTEKEMGRHLNDKHSDAPAMYECMFKPCPYKSKRESNCNQHMEKAHGWAYVRTKTPAHKKVASMLSSSVQQQLTPPLSNASTTSPANVSDQRLPEQLPSSVILPSDSGYASVTRLNKCSMLFPTPLAQDPSSSNDLDADYAQDPATNERGDQDMSDANTVYSDAASLSDETKANYIDALVDDLLGRLSDIRNQPAVASRVAKLLPALLKTLALGIGSSSHSLESRDVMVFIHKHRFLIAAALESRFKVEYDEEEKSHQQIHRPTEVMDRWLHSKADFDYSEIPENDVCLGDEGAATADDNDETPVPCLDEYRKVVHSSHSYSWLVGRLQREMNTSESAPGVDAMERIRADLLAAFALEDRVSRRAAPQPITAQFMTEWRPLNFLNHQTYEETHSQAIANAITLTGTHTDAQALTCSQYLAQTWPSTGHHTLRLIQLLIEDPSVPRVKITVTDPAPMSLEALLDGGAVAVTASGLPEHVVEIGQQLAWMSAAMNSSDESKLCENTPFLDHIALDGVLERTVNCDVGIRTKPYYKPESQKTEGQCWHDMFHNPVIACGFPIRSRSTSTLNTGLEMSLDIMAAMADTRYINVFNSGTFIKGFSSMLVPTGRSEDILLWHHLYKKNAGERISYWDFQLPYVDVGMVQLETSRHILGWCSDADSLVGSSDASYDIRRSRLPRTHAGCSLDKVELQAGQFVQATAAFTLGKREKPVHISRNGYQDKLNWISSKYVILWDEGDNAGWLCSGTRGLVHLLRASLEHSKAKFKSSFLLDPKTLPDILTAGSIDGMEPALSLLLDRGNRQLRLYVDKDGDSEEVAKDDASSKPQTQYYTLQDRVDHLYYVMEKLIEWQTNTEQRSGLSINACPRKQLEGWDFRDVVAGGDPFFPRVATLPAVGKGWVDFARSIQAVTLFGRGFGQLMRPRTISSALGGPCRIWSSLPTGRHYLAAQLSDLSAITQDHGDPTSNPVYLSDNVIWHVKAKAFDPCLCPGTNCHHEPVQVLFPSKFTTKLCKKASPATLLQSNGAVIFGHNKRLRWYWKDFGDPVKGDPEEEVESDSISSFADSALGSSIESARSPSSELGSLPSTPSGANLSPAGGSWKRGLRDAASSLNKRARRL